MKVRLHPEARAELLEARNWYYERSPLTSVAFAYAFDRAVARITTAPDTHPLADYGTRKLVLQRFPFNVFYRVAETLGVIMNEFMQSEHVLT
jgi:plasmid stabilization system protein ParE